MIIVNKTGEFITGSMNGQPFGVSFDGEKYQKMLVLQQKSMDCKTSEEYKDILSEFESLTKESYKELVEHKTPFLKVNRHTNKFYLHFNGKTSSHALPKGLVERIVKSIEKEIPILPLIKCWVRFLRNPNYSDQKAELFAAYISAPYINHSYKDKLIRESGLSADVAKEMATTTQVAITQEGLLVGYKVSRELTKKFVAGDKEQGEIKQVERYDYEVDEFTGMKVYKQPEFAEDRVFEPAVMGQGGDAFLCDNTPGHVIRVGCIHELDSWDKVNCSDRVSCVKGLHVGGLNYILGYQNSGTVTHNVFIDPMDIGAIVGLGTGDDGAIRVKRYMVYSTFDSVNRTIYHPSTLSAITDAEFSKMVIEAIEKSRLSVKDESDILDSFRSLEKLEVSAGGDALTGIDKALI